jgi:hypothetical protein
MPSPATRARKALLAVLAAMAILTGLIPAALIHDRGLPVAATATHRRPDDDDDDDSDGDDDSDDSDDSDDTDDTSDDDDSSDDSDDDDVDEEKLPDNVKAILKKERQARRDAERKLKQATRKPAAKPKPKPKPGADDTDDGQGSEPTERERKATERLRRANLITVLSRSKHGLVDPAAAAKLALQDKLADFDDDDEPTDVDDLVAELVEAYGFLKGEKPKAKPKPAPNIDSGDKPSKKAPKLTAEQLEAAKAAKMTPERYAALLHGGSLDDWQRLTKDADKKK